MLSKGAESDHAAQRQQNVKRIRSKKRNDHKHGRVRRKREESYQISLPATGTNENKQQRKDMENRYKIILSGNQIYKEAELPADMERVTVGTGIDCTVRLRRDLFFESIQIEFVKESGGWRATCSVNLLFWKAISENI